MPTDPPPQNAAPSEAWLQPVRGPRAPLGTVCNIGRASDNDVVVQARKASRYHAAIRMQAEHEFLLVDLGSANGTFHNGRRVIRPTPLHDGDRVTIADATFCFRQLAPNRLQVTDGAGQRTLPEFTQEPSWLVMADLIGYSALTAEYSGEELARLLQTWTESCQTVIEQNRGQIGKYLGDGLLAYWIARETEPRQVAAALQGLHRVRSENGRAFRLAVHYGTVTFGGVVALGEEQMRGSEVNFIFRLERLASTLGLTSCISEAARRELGSVISTEAVGEAQEVKGFEGSHKIYSILWETAAGDSE